MKTIKILKDKIGFIGCGNMGGAVLEGLLRRRIARPGRIFIFDPDRQKMNSLHKRFHVRICCDNSSLVNRSQLIILAVKPQGLQAIAGGLRPFPAGKSVISILAGTPVAKIRRCFGKNVRIVRAMPNLSAKVSEAITVLTGDSALLRKAELIFTGCGQTMRLPERYFDLVTAVSGSGPAYFFFLMEMLAQFAVSSGLSENQANLLAVQTALGAAKLADVETKHARLCEANASLRRSRASLRRPAELRKQVTSKGGTTAAAMAVLEGGNVRKIWRSALKGAMARAKELSCQ